MRSLSKQSGTLVWVLGFFLVSGLPLWADAGTEPPVPVRTVAPTVPRNFSMGDTSGLVTVSLLVDEKGNVQEPTIVKSSHKELEQPALEAVKQWRFKPAKKDGNPVAIRVAIPIKFTVS